MTYNSRHDGRTTPPAPTLQEDSQTCRGKSDRTIFGPTSCRSHFGKSFRASHLSSELSASDLDFLSNHLAQGTKSGYGYAFKKFQGFCSNLNVDPFKCAPAVLVKYIRTLYNEGASYSKINYHRSCIAKFHLGLDGVSIGKHPLVCQAVKAVFRLRPPLPRYIATYDISIVFSYLQSLPSNEQLPLKQLSFKTLFLLTASTISRVSSVRSFGSSLQYFQVSPLDIQLKSSLIPFF